MLRFDRKQQNSVKQLSCNGKINKIKKKKKKNTGVGCHSLLQRIFLTQELNPGLLRCRQILYSLNYREDQVSGI